MSTYITYYPNQKFEWIFRPIGNCSNKPQCGDILKLVVPESYFACSENMYCMGITELIHPKGNIQVKQIDVEHISNLYEILLKVL
jgi:hypothetical protein